MTDQSALRILIADDSADDALLVERFMNQSGQRVAVKRVWTLSAIERELQAASWDVMLSDYHFNGFTAAEVLKLAHRLSPAVPVLIVSGTIGEEMAAGIMRAGARDFIRKSNLSRLPAAIERELDDAKARLDTRRLHELVINSAPIALYAVDADGVFTLSEGKGLEPIGLRAGEIVGRRVLDLYGNLPGVSDHLDRVLAGEKHEIDITIKTTRYHLISIPTRDQSGAVTGLSGVAIDVTESSKKDEQLRSTINELAALADERRRLLRHLVTAQEQERQRIAADLHDDTIQVIASVGLRIGALQRRMAGTPYADQLQRLELQISDAVKRTRQMLFDLNPRSLESSGLCAAISEYLDQVARDDGLGIELVGSLMQEPPLETRMILYRVTQEAIANVRKHAKAQKVTVALSTVKDGVLVKVEDDGIGFDPKVVKSEPGHMGLTGMRERLRLGHGWLRVESAPREGTSVEFWMPLVAHDNAA